MTIGAPLSSWTFDTNESNWEGYSEDPNSFSVGWTSAAGYEAAGAVTATLNLVEIDAFTSIKYDQRALTDMQGRILTVRVLLQSGSNITGKLYVQTTDYAWADGGTVPLEPGVWTCLALDMADPTYVGVGADYDPTNVVEVGVRVRGMGEVTVLLDDVQY